MTVECRKQTMKMFLHKRRLLHHWIWCGGVVFPLLLGKSSSFLDVTNHFWTKGLTTGILFDNNRDVFEPTGHCIKSNTVSKFLVVNITITQDAESFSWANVMHAVSWLYIYIYIFIQTDAFPWIRKTQIIVYFIMGGQLQQRHMPNPY